MIDGSRQLPVQHITIRVPWHDNGWQGTFCSNPCANTSCTILPRIATGRDDAHETVQASKCFKEFDQDQLPPCVDEHGTIMAPFPLSMIKEHPYREFAKETHGHFAPTPYTIPPYSAAAIPFRWMLKEQAEGNDKHGIISMAEALKLGYEARHEPDLKFNTSFIQEGNNQCIMLDTFSSAIKPDQSLVFFYAKRTPLVEDPRRVIIGVGRVKTVGFLTEYRYTGGTRPNGRIQGFLWERNIEHSIRPKGNNIDGFLLPYHNLLELAEDDDSFNFSDCTAFAPNEYFEHYSYGSELLPQDGAIASLLAIEKSINAMRGLCKAPWADYLKWIDRELNRLWQVRGAFPGLGAALHAFGLPNGNLLAWHLIGETEIPVDPWPMLTAALRNSNSLPEYLREGIGNIQHQRWERLPDQRRALLKLIARFNLTNDQAMRWYQRTERENAGIILNDAEIIANPYRIYEEDRFQPDPIAYDIIDRGIFPPEPLRGLFPVPEPSRVHEAIDERRVRAVMIQTLEESANDGHTLLPASWLIQRIRERPMKPECPLDEDTLPIIDDFLEPYIATVEMNGQGDAYQLERYVSTSELIRDTITNRKGGKTNDGEFNWRALVDSAINLPIITPKDEQARREKAAALPELFHSRISVLLGPAGTGKSKLLKALCAIDSVLQGGVLFLAPTGKARVRLELATGMVGEGKTIAQFLYALNRYDAATGRYYITRLSSFFAGKCTTI